MNDAADLMSREYPHLGLLEKLAVWLSWGLSAWIFLTIGWQALRPDDPLGPITLLSANGGILMLLKAGLLAVVAAALATVVAGRYLADAGVFAAALGITLVSLRGGTFETVLLARADAAVWPRLEWKLAGESIAWFGVILVSLIVSGMALRWRRGTQAKDQEGDDRDMIALEAIFDIPVALGMGPPLPQAFRTDSRVGLRHTAIVTAAGFVLFYLFSAGWRSRSIQHGQACFIVVASICLASYIASHWAPVRSALWSILSVGILAVIGYVSAGLHSTAASLPPGAPASPFLQVLPIQFIAAGTASAVGISWYLQHASGEGGDDHSEDPPAGRLAPRS